MSEKELKKYVDEYFKKYMCVSFDKFIENWNETSEYLKYYKKENKKLKEQNSILSCQLEEMRLNKTDYTEVNILEMKLKQRDEVIKEAIKKTNEIKDFGFDKIAKKEILGILQKYKGDPNVNKN